MTFPRGALAGDTLEAAHALLGARLVRDGADGRREGRIVEVEAYVGTGDRASHARFGRTRRNAVMFGPPGVAYVYLVYGMYECLNVVTEADGRAAALLVRAVEPIDGAPLMRDARLAHFARRRPAAAEGERARLAALPTARLAAGPGLVCAAFGIDRSDDGTDLCDPASSLRLEAAPPGDPRAAIMTGPRVGIGYAGEPWLSNPWRFWLAGNPAVSTVRGGAG